MIAKTLLKTLEEVSINFIHYYYYYYYCY